MEEYRVNFNAAFDGVSSRSRSGVVARDSMGLVLASKAILTQTSGPSLSSRPSHAQMQSKCV